MRSLERNKQTIYYALYGVKSPVLDEFGNDTGETTIGYGNPVKFKIRVSPSKGETEETAFGKMLDYDRVMYTADKTFPIDENTKLFVDSIPVFNEDGTSASKPDYKVVGVSKDLNEWQFAIKKVS
jgi:hypothetical protein